MTMNTLTAILVAATVATTSVAGENTSSTGIQLEKPSGLLGFMSDQRTPPEAFQKEIGRFDQKLGKAFQNLQDQVKKLGDLNQMTMAEAIERAEGAIGTSRQLLEYLKEGGQLDQSLSEAQAYHQRIQTLIMEHPSLSESRRTQLLSAVSDNISGTAVQRSRIDGSRQALNSLLAKATQDKDYLVLAEMTNNGKAIVEAIKQTADTLNEMANILRSMSTSEIPTG